MVVVNRTFAGVVWTIKGLLVVGMMVVGQLPPFHERAPLASPSGLLDGRMLRCLRLKSSSPCHGVGNSAITPPQLARHLGVSPHWLYDRLANGRIQLAKDP